MHTMRCRGTLAAILTACWLMGGSAARGDQFFLRYDANQFPEQAGWERYHYDPQGQLVRTLENGLFRLDTRGSNAIFDLYELVSDAFILEPEEELRVTWRMQTLETSGSWGRSDVIMGIVNESHAYVGFFLGTDFVSEDELGGGEPEHLYLLDPQRAHSYRFITDDMEEYDLFVDDAFAFHGCFHDYAWRDVPRVSFGDAITGRRSLSEWDYVEVAVVPEAPSALLVGPALVLLLSSYRRLRG